MSKVIADITMSLDGYVTGPSADSQHGLGDVDELHAWVTEQDPVDTEILERATAATGAVVMGRRLFDIVDTPDGWTKVMGYGAQQAGTPPFFVVTHSAPQDVRLERELGMRFTFVDDLTTAVDQDRTAATDGHVVIMGRWGRHRPGDLGQSIVGFARAPDTEHPRSVTESNGCKPGWSGTCTLVQVDTQIDGEPDAGALARAVATLKLLADETRLRIVWNLLHGEHNVNELAEHLGMQPAAISHHLAKLRLAGVVRTRRDGNRIYYAARDRHIEGLVAEALRPADHTRPRSA